MVSGIPARQTNAEFHEQAMERLTDVLFAADDVLELLEGSDAMSIDWIEPHVRKVQDEVNALMNSFPTNTVFRDRTTVSND